MYTWDKLYIEKVFNDYTSYSGMDLLTWPNVTLEQFHELIPALKHLEPSLRERIMIEGTLAG